ncbi:MAG: glutamine--fructose-6-phosphate transaminase (isomerizing) [Clostridia bacterium]|nr:glutamine--fructose-6-phosphate transaminase (isomerizing) [Clostridia bacterium]
MCGICAGIGKNQTQKVVDGLKKLEYRGYDSSGIAFLLKEEIEIIKSVGQIKNLEKMLEKRDEKVFDANIVIGHTRWATHGGVCEENAHPHISENGEFAMVHNGIIENYQQIKKGLSVELKSQTDTEVFVNLVEGQNGTALQRLISACQKVEGSFAVAVLCKDCQQIFLAKKASPLMVAVSKDEVMAASDISVFSGRFDECFSLDDGEFAVMSEGNVEFFDLSGERIEKEKITIKEFDYPEENLQESHFMLKEIKEQPVVLRRTFFKFLAEDVNVEELKKFKTFHFVACGTAYHSCLLGARYLESFCEKKCRVSVASEFRYAAKIFPKNCLYVFVSQSGETADTIACAKLVKEKGCKVLCVTNVPYCTLNSLADFVIPTYAGKEVAVASTKAYTAQVLTLLILACRLSGDFPQELLKQFVFKWQIQSFDMGLSEEILKYKKIFFIGRGQDYVTSLEAALKLKEIAYVNCLGIAAGELKHGSLALVDDKTLVVAISTQEELREKMESNMLEVKARGGKILLVSQMKHNLHVDFEIVLPKMDERLMSIVSIVPLQQLAFEYSTALGFNPDRPRNLAKSVTVE